MGLGSLDIWFLYCWETGAIFDLPKGHTTVSRKRPLDGDVPVARRCLPARAVCIAVNVLLSMDGASARIFSSHGAVALASDAWEVTGRRMNSFSFHIMKLK